MSCTCEHIALCHQYLTSSAANTGRCLAPQCWCEAFKEGADAPTNKGSERLDTVESGVTKCPEPVRPDPGQRPHPAKEL